MNGNPQIEDGHIDIANELAEALARIRISGEEMQCLWVILRKTYGWHKKRDWIPLSQFQDMTNLKRPNIIRAIKKLITKNIVIKNDNGNGKTYGFNKHYKTWKPLSKKIIIKKVIKNDNPSLSKMIPSKENTSKENNTSLKENSLKEKTNEEEVSQTVAKVTNVKGSEMQELIKKFCDTMGYEYNPISIRLNVKPAKELLQTYTIDEIIEAVEYGKRKYEKENRDPKTFITNLQAVLNSIVRWRGSVKEEIETKEKNKRGGYVI